MYVTNEAKATSANTSTFIVRWDHAVADLDERLHTVAESLSDLDGAVAVVVRGGTGEEEAEGAWAHDQLLGHLLHERDEGAEE